MVVDRVDVSAGGVGLPHLDERSAHRTPVGVGHAAADDDPLAERLSGVLPRQVGILGPRRDPAEHRSGRPVKPFASQLHRLVPGRPQLRRAVVGMEIRRFELHLARHP